MPKYQNLYQRQFQLNPRPLIGPRRKRFNISDYIDENEYDEEPEEDETFEPDPTTVAFLDQQEAEFAGERERFSTLYGFDHECTCSQDYSSGKVGQVTECFMSLTMDALGRCAEATHEVKLSQSLLQELLKINDDLVKMLEDTGNHQLVEDYFSRDMSQENIAELPEFGAGGGPTEKDWNEETDPSTESDDDISIG